MVISLDGVVVRNATASQKAGVSTSAKADMSTGAFDLANKSVGQQIDATNVRLSPFAQVKSSFVDVQSAGNTLTTPAKSSTIEDVTKDVQSFANAYNNATKIINSSGELTGALVGNANTSSDNLKSIVTSGDTAANLKNIGITVNQDGTLSVDTNTLQTAMQANSNSVSDTLASVGAQAVLVSQNELGGSGEGEPINPLNSRTKLYGPKTTGQQKVSTDSQNSVQKQNTSVSSTTAGGIAAYIKMVSR